MNSDDTDTSIQNQNLIGDDVADEINAAIAGDQMNGSVTPPTVVQPTHATGALLGSDDHDEQAQPAEGGTVATPDEPAVDPAPASEPASTSPAVEPAAEEPTTSSLPPAEPADDTAPVAPTIPDEDRGSGNFSELQAVKQDALTQLGPLVQHLDQGAEERFNTLLMMIRASDDASLVQTAYEAAKEIVDDKKKAQALLDIVNEVNYLTRPQPEDKQA